MHFPESWPAFSPLAGQVRFSAAMTTLLKSLKFGFLMVFGSLWSTGQLGACVAMNIHEQLLLRISSFAPSIFEEDEAGPGNRAAFLKLAPMRF